MKLILLYNKIYILNNKIQEEKQKKSGLSFSERPDVFKRLRNLLFFLHALCPRILRVFGTQDSGKLLRIGILKLLQNSVQMRKSFRTFGDIREEQ